MEVIRDRHGIVRRAALVEHGYSDSQIAGWVSREALVRLGHGAYAVASRLPTDASARAEEVYRLRCIGHATSGRAHETVLSHQSAATVHRLAMIDPDRERVHTTNRSGGGMIGKHRHIHRGPLADEDITAVRGVGVTSLPRTAIDVACGHDFAAALAVLDSTRRRGVSTEQLIAALAARRRVGAAMARRALQWADGSSESAGESLSRAHMIDGAVPLPRLQVRYRLPSQVAVVDFDWEGKLVGEFDGMVKYGRLIEPGRNVNDVVLAEKKRQDELERLGPKVIRWTWADVLSGRMLADIQYWTRRLGIRTV